MSALPFAFSGNAEAVTRVNGNFSLEETYASGPEGSTNALEGGVNLDITPQTRKNLRSRFTLPLRFSISDSGNTQRLAPAGMFAVDLGGESYNVNLQYGRTVTVSSTAELTDSTTSRAAFSLLLPDLPKLFASYSNTESTTGATTTDTDSFSLFSDYRYQWLTVKGGYSASGRSSGGTAPLHSSSLLFGMGANHEVLPRTSLSADYDFSRSSSDAAGADATVNLTHAFRMNMDSRPLAWFGLSGNFTSTVTDFNRESSEQRFTEFSATLYPYHSLRFYGTVGERSFNDLDTPRKVSFTTLGAGYSDRLFDKVQLGASLSRSMEEDLSQGKNQRDNMGINLVTDLTPLISVRGSLSVNRNGNEQFVSAKRFDADGTIAERDALAADPTANLPPGFIFFDAVNGDLYTLLIPFDPLTSGPAVWSLPVHLVTEQFSVSKNVQVNMTPTDKTVVAVSYTSNAASDSLDLGKAGSQSLNGSLTYAATRRASYSLSGTAGIPEVGDVTYSGTATMAYRFIRRHQMNLGYSRQSAAGKIADTASGSFTFALRKNAGLELLFAVSQLFEQDQRYFIKARFTTSF